MLVIGICGSPRDKATNYVLKKALEELTKQKIETRYFSVKGKKINYCIHCDYCLTHKECAFKDDMQQVYSLLKEANGIIFATPVYNGGVSAQTKAIMDRCRAAEAGEKNFFKNKIGMGIALGGDRVGGQEPALIQILTFYILNGIIPVSGGYFGSNLGATFWTKDTLEGVKQDKEGFRSLKKTLKNFIILLKRFNEEKTGD